MKSKKHNSKKWMILKSIIKLAKTLSIVKGEENIVKPQKFKY